uniref:ANTAR domain-containing protein n=1 Tax=Promicromonospora panici TaxID=2219658 RepID=UPI0013EA262E
MSLVDQPQDARVDDGTASSAVAGEAMIERAKSVVVVARRVDEDEAGQILFDAARQAHIPLRMAADQVMTALQADECPEGITHDTLMRALAAVHPLP